MSRRKTLNECGTIVDGTLLRQRGCLFKTALTVLKCNNFVHIKKEDHPNYVDIFLRELLYQHEAIKPPQNYTSIHFV